MPFFSNIELVKYDTISSPAFCDFAGLHNAGAGFLLRKPE